MLLYYLLLVYYCLYCLVECLLIKYYLCYFEVVYDWILFGFLVYKVFFEFKRDVLNILKLVNS